MLRLRNLIIVGIIILGGAVSTYLLTSIKGSQRPATDEDQPLVCEIENRLNLGKAVIVYESGFLDPFHCIYVVDYSLDKHTPIELHQILNENPTVAVWSKDGLILAIRNQLYNRFTGSPKASSYYSAYDFQEHKLLPETSNISGVLSKHGGEAASMSVNPSRSGNWKHCTLDEVNLNK